MLFQEEIIVLRKGIGFVSLMKQLELLDQEVIPLIQGLRPGTVVERLVGVELDFVAIN